MTGLSDAVGRRVVAKSDASVLGSVQRCHLDATSGRISAIQVDGPAGGRYVDWSAIEAFGPDVVVVDSPESLRGPRTPWEERLAKGELDPRGKPVYTADGDLLGKLRDVRFDEADGRIHELDLHEGSVAVERLVAVGPDAVIVPAEVSRPD